MLKVATTLKIVLMKFNFLTSLSLFVLISSCNPIADKKKTTIDSDNLNNSAGLEKLKDTIEVGSSNVVGTDGSLVTEISVAGVKPSEKIYIYTDSSCTELVTIVETTSNSFTIPELDLDDTYRLYLKRFNTKMNISSDCIDSGIDYTSNNEDAVNIKIDALSSVNIANEANYTLSGSCSENSRDVTVDVGGISNTVTCSSDSWSITLDLSSLLDGSVEVSVSIESEDGSIATDTASGVKDTSAPTVSITSSPDINAVSVDSYTISGDCSENDRTVNLDVGGIATTTTCSSGSWSKTLSVATLSDGAINITADLNDAASNSATQATVSVSMDATIPTVSVTSSPNINTSNVDSYTISGECSENDRTVTLDIGGIATTATCTIGSWSKTLSVATLSDGAINVTADLDDAASNNATQATVSISMDTVAPTVSFTSTPDINVSNKDSYTISGACSEFDANVTLDVGGISTTANCLLGSWSKTINVASLSDGVVTVTADHSDTALNNATQATVDVSMDATIPTVSITSSPNINSSNESSYTISGDCSENDRIVSLDVGGIATTVTCSSGSWSKTLSVATLSDGTINITADINDAASNNAVQATVDVSMDTVVPTVSITSSPDINTSNESSYTISGNCSENDRTVTLDVGGIATTATCTTGSWSKTLSVATLSDGTITITADISDAASNNAVQATVDISKDATAPSVSITSSPIINASNEANYTISGDCSENGRTITLDIGGIATTASCNSGSWSKTVDTTTIVEGNVTITADIDDAATNNAVQASVTVVKNTSAPTVAITSSPNINSSNESSYTFAGDCSENGRDVTLNIGGIAASATCATLSWSVTLNVSSLSDGAVTITADHDNADLNAATQASVSIIMDTIVPTVSITSSPNINTSNESSYTISGNCSENDRTVSLDVGGIATTATCTIGSWSKTLSVATLSDGTVTITADISDAASNNAGQATVDVSMDTALPTISITSSPNINTSNEDSYTISGNCSENDRTVTLDVGGIATTATCTTGSWSKTLSVASLSDGTITITADLDDAASNNAVQASIDVSMDATVPTVSITSSPNINTSNESSYTISGSCSENDRTVTLDVGGISTTATCTIGSWSKTLSVATLSDGTITITADISDAASNNAVQATVDVSMDATVPTISISTSPNINTSNEDSYTISGNCSENDRTITLDIGGIASTTTCSSGSWSKTLNVATLSDGTITITADIDDAASNNAVQATVDVSMDATVPTVIITSSPNINTSNESSYTISGSCSENDRTVNLDIGGIATTTTCSSGSWSKTLSVATLSDGTITITADIDDAASNNAVQVTVDVSMDATIPSVSITSSPNINTSNEDIYTISGNCSENDRTVTLDIGGIATTTTCSSGSWSKTLSVATLSDGTITITADIDDAASNNAVQATVDVLMDTALPTISISTSPNINTSNESSYTISGNCSENDRTITLDIGGIVTTTTCSSGSWSKTLSVATLSDGTITITADISDAASNNAVQATVDVSMDATVPTVSITSSPNINTSNEDSYTISGSCSENDRTVTLNVGGIATTTTCSSGSWSKTLSVATLSDGTITITADIDDAASNNAVQETVDVSMDTAIPTISITSSPDINTSNESSYTISGDCSENDRTVSLDVGGIATTATCLAGSWSKTISVVTLSDGTITITADISDAASNNAVQATVDVSMDATVPTVSITSSPNINTSNESSYTISGSCSENDRTVTLDIGGIATTATCLAGSWSKTLSVATLSDGTITITADIDDAASNNAVQATVDVTMDATIPSVSITSSPTINSSNESSYTISGDCSENDRAVSLDVGGISTTSTCTTGSWSKTLSVATLSDGSITITADIDDAASNNAVQATVDVSMDTVIPIVAINAASTINGTNETTYGLSGSCSDDGQNVSISIGTISTTVVCSSNLWNKTINVSTLSDGAINISADHTDLASNSAVQATTSVTKDSTDPTVSITSSPSINTSNESDYTISGECSENGINVSIEIGSISTTATCSTLTWSKTLDVSSLSDGNISVDVDHTDAALNSAINATASILKDTTAPTVAISSSAVINSSNENSYTVSGTCSEETTNVEINIGSISTTASCSSGAWTKNIDVSTLADGNISITADHADVAGNNAAQASISVEKDTTAPVVTIDALATINSTNDTSYTLSGTCVDEGEDVVIDIGGITTTTTCSSSAWSTTQNVTTLSDGTISVSADHSDPAGNSATQSLGSVVKDSTLPTITLNATSTINAYNQLNYSLSGTCSENNRNVTVNIGSISENITCTTTSWSSTYNVSTFSDGAVAITVDHTDAAGNSATQISTSVTKDATLPTVTISALAAVTTENESSYTVNGTCSENGQNVVINVATLSATVACASGAWTNNFDISSLSDGTLSITADHDDSNANSATQATTSIEKATDVAPAVFAMNTPLEITLLNQTNYFLEGTCTDNGSAISISIGSISTTTNCSSNVWSIYNVDISSLSDGAISITADHTTNDQQSATVDKDINSPSVSITRAPHIITSNEQNYIASGSCSDNSANVTVTIGTFSDTYSCSSNTWTTGFIDLSGLADSENITVTAQHSTATDAQTTIYKDTFYPVAINLSLSNTLNDTVVLNFELENPNSFSINDYIINYRQKGTDTWIAFDDGVNVSTVLNVTGLNPGMYYEIRVSCLYDNVNYSNWSNIVTGQTQPDSPVFGLNKAMNVGGATSSEVIAFQNATTITLNGVALTNLNAGQSFTFTSSAFDIIDADKPIFTIGSLGGANQTDKNAGIVWMPTSWAGKSFGFSNNQTGSHELKFYAIEDTEVSLIQGTTVIDSASLSAGANTTFNWSVSGPYQIVSTGSILAFTLSTGNGTKYLDAKPLMPNSDELIGIPSSIGRIATTVDFTTYNFIHSNSTTGSGVLNKTTYYDINPQGTSTSYESQAVLVNGSNGINGASFDDGQGDASAPFMPTNLMRQHFIIPTHSNYISFASKECGSIQVKRSNGNLITTLSLTRSGGDPLAPCKAYYSNPNSGYIFSADVPVAAWFEPDNNSNSAKSDETIMVGTNEAPF